MPSFDRSRYKVVKPDSSRALPIPAQHRWVFAHPPVDGWEVADIDGQPRWIPRLRRLTIMPGANGVDKRGDDREYLFTLAKNGWTVIENGGPAGVYADEVIARNGTAWLDRWCTLHEYAPGRVDKRVTDEQRAEFQAWCANLVDVGALPEPDPVALERECERFEDMHIRRMLSRETMPSVALKLERARAKLARMRAASLHAEAEAEAKPKPKPRRRRSKAASNA